MTEPGCLSFVIPFFFVMAFSWNGSLELFVGGVGFFYLFYGKVHRMDGKA